MQAILENKNSSISLISKGSSAPIPAFGEAKD